MEALQGADLGALADLAAHLGVESYLLNRLGPSQERLGPEPARFLAGLRQRVAAVAVTNLLRDEMLAEALTLLTARGVDFILLKGSALRLLRPEMVGRFQCDVDFLLRRRDLETAEEILTRLGFQLDETFRTREDYLDGHFHLGFEKKGAMVEVHWDVDPSTPPGFVELLWARSQVVSREGREWRILAPEHRLLFGCLHLSRHGFVAGLRWLADLALELPASADDLERFAADARGWPPRAVYVPLWMLGICGAPGAEGFGVEGLVGRPEAAVARNLLIHLLLGEPWHGLPGWRAEHAAQAWLFSERPLLPLLAEASGSVISKRIQAWVGRA